MFSNVELEADSHLAEMHVETKTAPKGGAITGIYLHQLLSKIVNY